MITGGNVCVLIYFFYNNISDLLHPASECLNVDLSSAATHCVSPESAFFSSFFCFLSLNRMSLITLSFLSLPSSPSLTPGSPPDSWQTTLPVWLQIVDIFFCCFFILLSMFSTCNVHPRTHFLYQCSTPFPYWCAGLVHLGLAALYHSVPGGKITWILLFFMFYSPSISWLRWHTFLRFSAYERVERWKWKWNRRHLKVQTRTQERKKRKQLADIHSESAEVWAAEYWLKKKRVLFLLAVS